jgi:hypothetical protein
MTLDTLLGRSLTFAAEYAVQMEINVDLLKQCRETADWFLHLPEKLVSAVMSPKEIYLNRHERIQKARELAALREVGKTINTLYATKGNIFVSLNRMQRERAGDVRYVQDLFGRVARNLEDISSAVSEMSLSNAELAAEISFQIGKAKATYEALSDLPEEAILDDRRLLDILEDLDQMKAMGDMLLRMVDGHRKHLDDTYD